MGREKNRHTSSPSSFSSQERRPKKIPRSCLACHQRKVRCSMELPACFACRKHARTLGEDPANTRCSYYDQRSGRLESPPQASESRKEGKRKSVKLDDTVMDEVVEDGFIAGMGTGRDSRRLAREGGTVASHSYDVAPTLPPTPTSPLISDFPGVDVPSASSPRSPLPSPPLKLRNFPAVFNTSLPSLPPSKVVTPLDDAFAAVSPAPVIQEYDSLDDFSFSSSSAYENGISPGVFGNGGISPGVFAKEGQVPLWAM